MRLVAALLATALALLPTAAVPALRTGDVAPDFVTTGALAGRPFRMRLRDQLRHGPVVLYFYPRAFTEGCTLEARAFSEAARDFRRAGARVIGMSADDYDTLRRFSVEGCRSAFPVATASAATIQAYDVRLREGAAMTNRTSYVIAPNGPSSRTAISIGVTMSPARWPRSGNGAPASAAAADGTETALAH